MDARAVRFTQDVDLLIRRQDLDLVAKVLAPAGFTSTDVLGVPMFLDGPAGSVRDALHVLFDNEKVQPDYFSATPDVKETAYETLGRYRILAARCLGPHETHIVSA